MSTATFKAHRKDSQLFVSAIWQKIHWNSSQCGSFIPKRPQQTVCAVKYPICFIYLCRNLMRCLSAVCHGARRDPYAIKVNLYFRFLASWGSQNGVITPTINSVHDVKGLLLVGRAVAAFLAGQIFLLLPLNVQSNLKTSSSFT